MRQRPQKYCTERPQGKSRVKQLLRRGARISTQVQQGYDPQTIHYSLAGPSEVFGTTVLRNTGKDLVYGCTHLWWEQVPWVGVLAKAGKERLQNHRWPLEPLSLVIWRYSIHVSILQRGACFPHLHTLPLAHTRSEQQIDMLPEWPSGTQMQYPELGFPLSLQSCSPAHFHCPMNGTAVSLVSKFKNPTMSNFSFSHKPRPPWHQCLEIFFILCLKFLLLHPLPPYLCPSSHPQTMAIAFHPVSLVNTPPLPYSHLASTLPWRDGSRSWADQGVGSLKTFHDSNRCVRSKSFSRGSGLSPDLPALSLKQTTGLPRKLDSSKPFTALWLDNYSLCPCDSAHIIPSSTECHFVTLSAYSSGLSSNSISL